MKGKALFLLVIFLLNTVVSLACNLPLGIDVAPSEAKAHEHGAHTHTGDHHHTEDQSNHSLPKHDSLQMLADLADACCQEEVEVFNLLVKNLSTIGKKDLKAPIYLLLPSFFHTYNLLVLEQSKVTLFIPDKRPASSVDIRIVISSFLI